MAKRKAAAKRTRPKSPAPRRKTPAELWNEKMWAWGILVRHDIIRIEQAVRELQKCCPKPTRVSLEGPSCSKSAKYTKLFPGAKARLDERIRQVKRNADPGDPPPPPPKDD